MVSCAATATACRWREERRRWVAWARTAPPGRSRDLRRRHRRRARAGRGLPAPARAAARDRRTHAPPARARRTGGPHPGGPDREADVVVEVGARHIAVVEARHHGARRGEARLFDELAQAAHACADLAQRPSPAQADHGLLGHGDDVDVVDHATTLATLFAPKLPTGASPHATCTQSPSRRTRPSLVSRSASSAATSGVTLSATASWSRRWGPRSSSACSRRERYQRRDPSKAPWRVRGVMPVARAVSTRAP